MGGQINYRTNLMKYLIFTVIKCSRGCFFLKLRNNIPFSCLQKSTLQNIEEGFSLIEFMFEWRVLLWKKWGEVPSWYPLVLFVRGLPIANIYIGEEKQFDIIFDLKSFQKLSAVVFLGSSDHKNSVSLLSLSRVTQSSIFSIMNSWKFLCSV